MKRHLFPIIATLLSLHANAQVDSIIAAYQAQVPQEKIYIQTDRRYYMAGDTVWFRAHVADAATNVPSTSPLYPQDRSRFVYVELHDNAADTLVERAMIKQDTLGVFANAIALPRQLETGTYTLVAYTRWMMNFPEELFAYKDISVAAVPPLDGTMTRTTDKDARVSKTSEADDKKEEDSAVSEPAITMAALPEGGNLIAGYWQRLAFKVTDSAGYGVDADIRLVRTDSDEIVTTARPEHKGMGSLFFTPEAGVRYRLEAYAANGLACHTAVPAALPTGVALTVSQRKGHLYVAPIIVGIDPASLSLAIYGNGNLVTIPQLTEKPVSVDTSTLRPGVVNIAIVNATTKQVFAERLAFIYPQDTAAEK